MNTPDAIIEYELLGIEWPYDFLNNTKPAIVCDESVISTSGKDKDEIVEEDEMGIPTGEGKIAESKRRQIIHRFLQEWRHSDSKSSVFNKNLNEPIQVVQVSLREACKHSARSYYSTKAVLELETILAEARKVGESNTKPGDNSQKNFEKMLIMTHHLEGIGLVKLTVGVRRHTHEKVEYGLTAHKEGTPLINSDLKIKDKKSRHKKH
ncbi:MAG: hypothetical protein KBT20_00250 [Bacteroidales bacterium]|nr:hypothetical protein [Candidatus Liminaster caballi]